MYEDEPAKEQNKVKLSFPVIYTTNPKTKDLKCSFQINDGMVCFIDKKHSIMEGKLNDTIGLIEEKKEENHTHYRLYSYPRRKKFMSSQRRYVESQTFMIENGKAQEMKESVIQAVTNRKYGENLKLLIYFNPSAGANSKKHLNNILDFIKKTNLIPEVFTTQKRNHCLQHIKTINPSDYCAVAIVSGDGLMHEFTNGLVDIPVTHVPAGSGNAFAKSQTSMAKELCKDEESIFLVLKNRKYKFNVMKYQLEKLENPIYSFLSLQWAIIADLDMNSQSLRFLGGLRFDIYGAFRCLKMKRYRGRISYSTTQSNIPPLNEDLANNPNFVGITDTFLHTLFCSLPYIAENNKIAPLIKIQENSIDMQLITQEAGRMQLINYLLKSEKGSQFDIAQQKVAQNMKLIYEKVKSFRLQPLDPEEPGILGIDGESYDSQRIQCSTTDKKITTFI